MSEEKKRRKPAHLVSRRRFLGIAGVAAGGAAAAAGTALPFFGSGTVVLAQIPPSQTPAGTKDLPASQGYLVVDSLKCTGCTSCMLACSMVHEGRGSLSLARIQILQTAFLPYPSDLDIRQCRQCVNPRCVRECPSGALYVDPAHGNVRRFKAELCISCRNCLQACPYIPHRTVYNDAEDHSGKCDLCVETPYWVHTGGPGGTQACVSACPVGALKVIADIPDQTDTAGYEVNLRVDKAPEREGARLREHEQELALEG